MAESIVSDWLNDYISIGETEIHSFAAQHENNHDVSKALFTVLNERHKYPDLLHPVCNQFFSFYKSNENVLRTFTLQFVPILIYIYLNSVSQGDKKSCRSIETLLISIYNIEVSNEDGQPKVVSFRMPVLAQTSIYHEEKILNPQDLRRWEENSNKEVKWGPLPQVESLNAQNRLKVITAILFAYNQQISLIQKPALYHLCRVSSQIVNQGFSKFGHAHRSSYGSDPSSIVSKPLPRISVSSQFLLELLNATYFAMFNEFASIAIQTVDDVHYRACFEMFPDVILVTNAIKNSLHANPSGQPSDGPMGISVALTPNTSTVTVSKSMITNASFRTKKLPDDIPIQGPKDDPQNPGQLISITEEDPDPQLASRSSITRCSKESTAKTHKVPFPGFKKLKEKSEKKDKIADAPKNGISSTEVMANASKRLITKEKMSSSRSSVQMHLTGNSDPNVEGTKQKNINADVTTTNGPVNIEMTHNGHGYVSCCDDKNTDYSLHNSVDTVESLDSNNELSMGGGLDQSRMTIIVDSKSSQGSVQVSQV